MLIDSFGKYVMDIDRNCTFIGTTNMDIPSDEVRNPSHYTRGNIECIEAIEAALSPQEYIGFLRGQIAKYNWRMGLKGKALTDAQKCQWYAARLVEVLEKPV